MHSEQQHTQMTSLPSFCAKIIRIRKRLASASSALRGLFGASEKQDEAVAKLERLQVYLRFILYCGIRSHVGVLSDWKC